MRVSVIIAGIVAFIPASLATLGQPEAKGGFLNECSGIQLVGPHNSTLSASCLTTTKYKLLETELDLNLCIGYSNARHALEWDVYGKVNNECDDLKLLPLEIKAGSSQLVLFLTGDCAGLTDPNDSPKLDLNTGIWNEGGYMRCEGGIATTPHDPTTSLPLSLPVPTPTGWPKDVGAQ